MAQGGGEDQMTGTHSSTPDVFISFASADGAIASAVCDALEREGVSCWVAPRNVLLGEFYADAIVRAIDSTKAAVVVLSQNSITSPHVLREIERASSKRHPIISLRIDHAPLPAGLEYFLNTSQWLDASGADIGTALPTLVAAVRRVVTNAHAAEPIPVIARAAVDQGTAAPPATTASAAGEPHKADRATGRLPVNRTYMAIGALAVVALVVLAVLFSIRRPGPSHDSVSAVAPRALAAPAPLAAATVVTTAFTPPPHSVAVLPFVNMSGDPKQDYFSDGLSEELLNSLTSVRDLQVAARTSSFFFKGKEVDLSEIARKLNVGAVLEGSVRKDGGQVRITAQLINTVTGFHLWSHTYDRDLKDILKLQTEIAAAVTNALQATLLADAATKIELGGTQNPKAFDAYLRAKSADRADTDKIGGLAGIAAFDEAIRLDPTFAKAYSAKSLADDGFAAYYATGNAIREHFNAARAAAERALELAPDLGEAHSAFANVLANGFLDFNRALAENERAVALSPNDSGVLQRAGWFFVDIGRVDAGVAMAKRGTDLDQLNSRAYRTLANVLNDARQFREAIEAANRALSLNPTDTRQASIRGLALIMLGDVESARLSCETAAVDWERRMCLAIAYDSLHRRADAEAELVALKSAYGDATAYQFACIYAQWHDIPKALDWIEKAFQLRDPGVISLKADKFLDPLRNEPRFQQIERSLKFPN